jgi:hypothetical protein
MDIMRSRVVQHTVNVEILCNQYTISMLETVFFC